MPASGRFRPLHLGIQSWMLVVSLLAALPMLVLLLAVTWWRLEDMAQQQQARLQRQAHQTATQLAGRIEQRLVMLRTIAGGVAARDGLLPMLHQITIGAAASDALIGSISLTDAEGRQVFNSLAVFGATLPPTGVRDGERPVFEQGQTRVSPLVTGAYTGESVVGMAVPVRDTRGLVRYSLRATLRLAALAEVLAAQDYPPEWVAAVVDQRMRLLARSRDAERFVGTPATESLQQAIRAGSAGVVRAITKDGQPALTAIAAIGDTGWHLALGAPEAAIDRAERTVLLRVLLAGGIVVALGLAAALAVGRHVARGVIAAARPDAAPGPPAAVREVAQIRDRLDLARLDALTQLPARAAFLDQVAHRLTALPADEALGLLFIDLDGFKALNDTRGHEAGDRALQAVAGVLRAQLRQADLPARLGGDEFVVGLTAPRSQCAEIAHQVATRIVQEVGALGDGLGCSIGLAVSAPQDSLADLLQRADQAMYAAKRAGRGRVIVAP